MAVYKVPQDVEADDKLIGPFSFRQFIYLIIVAIGLFLGWVLGQIFIGLVLIPAPFVIFFGALALPLRKDQPMEIYLTAVIKFFLKPKTRLWNPDGSISMVSITAPQMDVGPLTKDFNGLEAQQRLNYLAQVVDTRGWSTRGVASAPQNISDTVVAEAQNTEDIMDESAIIVQNFDSLISREDIRRRQSVVSQVQQATIQVQTDDASVGLQPASSKVDFNPYPTSMHQRVIGKSQIHNDQHMNDNNYSTGSSLGVLSQNQTVTPSQSVVSPDTIRLANNKDLTISAIAREAHRLEAKDDEEVVISLR